MSTNREDLIARLEKYARRLSLSAARGSVNADNENYSCPVTIEQAREAADVMREAAALLRSVPVPLPDRTSGE